MYFFLKEPNSNKDTLIFLIYHVKSEKKIFKYSTGKKINPNDWDKTNRMPRVYRGAKGIQIKRIANALSKYSNFLESLLANLESNDEIITRKILKQEFDKKFKGITTNDGYTENVVEAIQDFITQKNKSGGQSRSWNNKYNNLKDKLIIFEKKHNTELKFKDINQNFMDNYIGFLRTLDEKPYKPLNDNSLNRSLGFFNTFLLWAKDKYHNIDLSKIKTNVSPYDADDIHLTEDELNVLKKLKLRPALERVRDLFLIGAYSGQRFSDYSVFEKADIKNGMIIKKAQKTKSESFIPLNNKLLRLLDKYDWKLPKISSAKFNKHIKEVCMLAEFNEEVKEIVYRGNKKEVKYHKKYEMVGSHTARRTFITLSAEKGMPDHIIMKITGIRNIETLQKYKKTSQKSVIDSMNKVWGD